MRLSFLDKLTSFFAVLEVVISTLFLSYDTFNLHIFSELLFKFAQLKIMTYKVILTMVLNVLHKNNIQFLKLPFRKCKLDIISYIYTNESYSFNHQR